MKHWLLLLMLATAMAENVYVLEMDENMEMTGVYLMEGGAPDKSIRLEEGYEIKLFTEANNTRYSKKFFVAEFEHRDNFELGGEIEEIIEKDEGVVLVVPYFETGDYFIITDEEGAEVARIDVSQFKQITKRREQAELDAELGSWIYVLGGVTLLALIGGGIYFFWKKRQEAEEEYNELEY